MEATSIRLRNLVFFEQQSIIMLDNAKEKVALKKMAREDMIEQSLGYGVMTDDINWQFFCFSSKYAEKKQLWTMHREKIQGS